MDGFQWTLKGKGSCLNLYFASWTLDTVPKFVVAMVIVVLLGIVTEWIARLRHDVSKYHRRRMVGQLLQRRPGRRHQQQPTGRISDKIWYIQTLLHGMNAFSAYILMLATMTYSLELLCCVILGLMIGYWVFGGDSYTHAGSPCCAFLDDDNNDSSSNRDDGTVMTTEFISTYIDTDEGGGHGRNDEDVEEIGDDMNDASNPAVPLSTAALTTRRVGGIADSNDGITTTAMMTTLHTGGDSCCGSQNTKV
jgi:Ctr copper transporter family